MKLLFDENLSPRLVEQLASDYADSAHVEGVGLRGAEDQRVWDFARTNGLTIVSKDTDFRERSFAEGFPPKVIWLDVGNSGTRAIATLLKRERTRVGDLSTERRAGGRDVCKLPLQRANLLRQDGHQREEFVTAQGGEVVWIEHGRSLRRCPKMRNPPDGALINYLQPLFSRQAARIPLVGVLPDAKAPRSFRRSVP
ncbi:MAG: DUF5615 family PIN-like protein [Chloroflexi bacterium]|nr:DUF5615 family PIN-like protein [Chloroflexota bacterium]